MAATVIIGATGGVGAALARRLHAVGRDVFLIARNAEKLNVIAGELGARRALADATDEAAMSAALAEAAEGGALAALAYCVGSIRLKPLKAVTVEDMAETYALNVAGAAIAVKHAAPALKAGRGAVVLFSSIAARQGFANHAVIGSAKAAVEGLTLALAAELAPDIRVNCIAPSLTDTGMAKPLIANPAMAEGIAKMHPLPRLGAAEDHAAVAAFLLSPEAGWITGQIFGVDGGRSTLRPRG